MAHWLKVRRKQSSFNTQSIPILADAAAGAVFRDTHLPKFPVALAEIDQLEQTKTKTLNSLIPYGRQQVEARRSIIAISRVMTAETIDNS